MGSTDCNEEELTVLVTGFGPFKENYPRNPSWEITRRLPAYLPRAPPKSPLQFRRENVPSLPSVRIQRHAEPIRVNYQVVRKLVPKLWDVPTAAGQPADVEPAQKAVAPEEGEDSSTGHEGQGGKRRRQKIDLMLHIGMAGPRPYYAIERRGHRDGYRMRDVDQELLGDEERHKKEGDAWVWHGLPEEILTDLDLGDVVDRWRGYNHSNMDLRVSEDAGRYLCDFIYYSSLAHLYRAGEHRRVVFLHVPADCSDAAVKAGVELVLGLIRSVLESEASAGHEGWKGKGKGEE